MNLKSYTEYKDSGVSWLGKVPKGWEMRKFRTILFPVAERNQPDLPLLSVVRDKGVIVRNITDDNENHNAIPEDLTNYKIVRKGQLAMNKMKAWQGSYGISKYDGIVSPAYYVFNLKNAQPHFFHLALRSKAYIPFFTQASDGIRVGQWDLSLTRMKEILFFAPSLPEQIQIARFLDWKTAQIARFIKAKKRMIELLKEQKQVIINDAVTGKIDVTTGKPYPKYKYSGVEWLGKVPEGWEVKRNMLLFKERNENGKDGLPILVVSLNTGVTVGSDIDEDGKPKRLIEDKSSYKLALKSDISFNMMRMWQGAVGKIPVNGLVSPAYIVASPHTGVNSDYYIFLFRTKAYLNEINRNSRGIVTDRNRLYWDDFKNITSTAPPESIQLKIVDFINLRLSNIDLVISRTEREISLIQEYRDRLIADVVTGKVDVREIEVPDNAEYNSIEDNDNDIADSEGDEMDMAEVKE